MRWLWRRRRSPVASALDVYGSRWPERYCRTRLREAPRVDRLLDEAVAADGEARVAVPLGGDRDDGHVAQRRLAAQPERHLVAVEAGDVEVDEDQVGPLRQSAAHALEAVGWRR